MRSMLPIVLLVAIAGHAVAEPLYEGDSVTFNPATIDKTLPDGFMILVGMSAKKQWRVENNGLLTWGKTRFVAQQNSGGFSSVRWTPIPPTKPGEECIITVWVTAPTEPGLHRTYYKMVELWDEQNRPITHAQFKRMSKARRAKLQEVILFPDLQGIWVEGIVVPRRHLPLN